MKNVRLGLILLFPALFAQSPPPATPNAPAQDAAAVPAAPAAPAGPTEAELAKVIADIRTAALSWEGKLSDFTCNRTGRLEVRTMLPAKAPVRPPVAKGAAPANQPIWGPWQMLQMLEDRVVYSDHKETTPLPPARAADNSATAAKTAAGAKNPPKAPAQLTPLLQPASIGLFTDILKSIFAENSHTEFKWKGIAGLHGLPVLVFEYTVPKENSTEEIVAGASRITVGYHGLLYADRLTHRVLTVAFNADVPADFPEQQVERVFTFGEVVIAGQFNLLPLKCEMQVRTSLDLLRGAKPEAKSPQLLARMTTEFLAYHKNSARTTPPLLVH